MNKKISTFLTAGLLLAGSLFGVANAQTTPAGLALNSGYPGNSEEAKAEMVTQLNKFYYLGAQDKTVYLTTLEVKNSNDLGTYYSLKTVGGSTDSEVNIAALKEEGNAALFKFNIVKIGGEYYYELVNKAGKTIVFKAGETKDATSLDFIAAGDNEDAVKSYISTIAMADFDATTGEGVVKPVHFGITVNTDQLGIAVGPVVSLAADNKIYLYEADIETLDATDLNGLGNGTFSLSFDEDETYNPFAGEMKAFKVDIKEDGSNDADYDYLDGMYFATSWPAALNGKDEINDIAHFNKSTFIALDALNNWAIHELDAEEAEGYKFTTVAGKNIQKDATYVQIGKGFVHPNNAKFAVAENDPINASGDYTLTMPNVVILDAEEGETVDKTNLIVAAVPDQKDLIVTTVNALEEDYYGVCSLVNSNLAAVKDILSSKKEASIFNIQFLSTVNYKKDNTTHKLYKEKTYSEYNKYLTLTGAGDLFAHGSDFVKKDAPESQWIITSAVPATNSFTFTNRENGKELNVQLALTDKANTYVVHEVAENAVEFEIGFVNEDREYKASENEKFTIDGTTIKLIPSEVNPTAGYVSNELDNAGLVTFKFTAVKDMLVAADLYLNEELKVTKDETETAMWTVVKFDASGAEMKPYPTDSLYKINNFAYWNGTEVVKYIKKTPYVAANDTIAVATYAFKLYGAEEDSYLKKDFTAVEELDDAADAARFLVKINKNGSYSLIPVKDETSYSGVITNNKTLDIEADGDLKTDVSIYYDYETRNFDFAIVAEKLGASLEAKPGYIAFNAEDRGYVGIEKGTSTGIVAPISSLKAYTAEDVTFRLDTADTDAFIPSFFISQKGRFMYNAADSAEVHNEGYASSFGNEVYANVYFKAATLLNADTLQTVVEADTVKVAVEEDDDVLGGLNNFKYQILQVSDDAADGYVIKSVGDGMYVRNINGKLCFAAETVKDALVVLVEAAEAPVANESIEAVSAVKVVAVDGAIIVKGAAGKNVTVANVLGQTIANTVVTTDEATITAPAGIVVVAVEGEAAVKAIVK